jgi:hypothetical protein
MLKEAIKLALRIFVIGLIATFLFHIINKDFTWTNFALALVVDAVISILAGVFRYISAVTSKTN